MRPALAILAVVVVGFVVLVNVIYGTATPHDTTTRRRT